MILMLSWLQAVLIVLIILLIITQTVSIRIRYNKRFIFDFDFTLVSFTFIPDKKRKNRQRENTKLRIRSIIKIADYVLSKAQLQITVTPRMIPNNDDPLIYGYCEIFRHIVLSYIDKNAVSVCYLEAESPGCPVDVTIKISFYHLACTLVLYLKESRKSKEKVRARL